MRFRNSNDWLRNIDFDPVDWLPNRRSQTPTPDILPALGIFSAGLLVGIGTALMLAPKPGAELRRDVARSVNKLGHDFREAVPGLPDREEASNGTSA